MIETENRDIKWIRVLLTVITVTIIVYILKELKGIILPLIFAIFLSILFNPIIVFLKKHYIPNWLTIILLMVIIFGLFVGLGSLFYVAINSIIEEFPKYQARMIDLIDHSYTGIQQLFSRFEVFYAKIPKWFDHSQMLSSGNVSIPSILSGTMSNFVEFLLKLFLTLIFLSFIVIGADKMDGRIKTALSENDNAKTAIVLEQVKTKLKSYFLSKTIISLGSALTSMLCVLLFKIDFVIMTGLLTFVLNFIPNIGSILGIAFPVLICLLQYGFGWRLIGVLTVLLASEMTFGNIIEPQFMADRIDLAPIVVLISLIFWGWVWGAEGMIIGVPITSAINILLKGIDKKNIISAIISDS